VTGLKVHIINVGLPVSEMEQGYHGPVKGGAMLGRLLLSVACRLNNKAADHEKPHSVIVAL